MQPGVTVTGVEVGLSPFGFVVITTTVYSVPFVSPVRTHDVAPNVSHSAPPGVACAVYPVIGAPPSSAGGVQLIVAIPLPAVAVTAVGAPGRPDGVTVTGVDAGPSPSAFVATTVTVYSVPFVSPVSRQLVAPAVEHDTSPGDAETVYP